MEQHNDHTTAATLDQTVHEPTTSGEPATKIGSTAKDLLGSGPTTNHPTETPTPEQTATEQPATGGESTVEVPGNGHSPNGHSSEEEPQPAN